MFPAFPANAPAKQLLATALLTALLSSLLTVPALAQDKTPAAVPVSTVIAQKQPVSQTKDFVGRIESVERVDVKARVTGFLDAVLFKEGDFVKAGQPLYRIEKGLF